MNERLDDISRRWITIGYRRVPAFRSAGIAGFHVALVVAIIASLRSDFPLVLTAGMTVAAGASFFVWGLGRRLVTGHENLVLLEYVWAGAAAVALFQLAAGSPIAPALDVYAVAVPVFLAFGRIGCLLVGCCYGIPWTWGIRYGPESVPPRLVGRRLLPVQAIEAVALVAITLVALTLVDDGPGRAVAWSALSYATIRFGLENLRSDRRPSVLGITVGRISCVIQAMLGLWAAQAWVLASPSPRAMLAAVAIATAALVAGVALHLVRRRQSSLVGDEHLDETWEVILTAVGRSRGEATGGVTSMGLSVVVGERGADRVHVSFAHPEAAAAQAVALALCVGEVSEMHGIIHGMVRIASGSTAQPEQFDSYFTRSNAAVVSSADSGEEQYAGA